jgi:hypothetical protein
LDYQGLGAWGWGLAKNQGLKAWDWGLAKQKQIQGVVAMTTPVLTVI